MALTAVCALTAVGSASGASSLASFYGDPPDEHHPWGVHDPNRPQPTVVTAGSFSSNEQAGKPPSDAIVLFGGDDISGWLSAGEKGGPAKWLVKDGLLQVVPKTGDIKTKEEFGDCQLHVEWSEPTDVRGSSQGRGNSGIFLMGLVEIQVLDSYHNVTYADGHAASVYGVNPPMVNALRPPGEFQVYDIIFRRPIYRDGEMIDPGHVSVLVNGVLVQDHTRLEGPTGHKARTHPQPFPEKGPLRLQDHGNGVRFRNIWYRPLPPRPVEGGTDGYLTAEASTAKRKLIAAEIRQDAEHVKDPTQPLTEMLRLAESLQYEVDAATREKVERMAAEYVAGLKSLPADQIIGKKSDIKRVYDALQFLIKAKALAADCPPALDIEKIVKERRWDKG